MLFPYGSIKFKTIQGTWCRCQELLLAFLCFSGSRELVKELVAVCLLKMLTRGG